MLKNVAAKSTWISLVSFFLTFWIMTSRAQDVFNGTKYDQWLMEDFTDSPLFVDGHAGLQLELKVCTECGSESKNCSNDISKFNQLWNNPLNTPEWWAAVNQSTTDSQPVEPSCERGDVSDFLSSIGGRTSNVRSDLKIYVNRVYYGFEAEDECDQDTIDAQQETCQSAAAPRMRQLVNCNGKQECVQYGALPAYVDDCDGRLQAWQFLRVDYQCISESLIYRLDTAVSSENRPASSYGYLMSPNYPDVYGHDLSLQCYFSLPDTGPGQVDHLLKISVLDFALEGERDMRHNGDGANCDDYIDLHEVLKNNIIVSPEFRHCGYYEPAETYTRLIKAGTSIRLVFITNSAVSARGFWLKFQVQDDDSVHVGVNCSSFDPNAPDTPRRQSDVGGADDGDNTLPCFLPACQSQASNVTATTTETTTVPPVVTDPPVVPLIDGDSSNDDEEDDDSRVPGVGTGPQAGDGSGGSSGSGSNDIVILSSVGGAMLLLIAIIASTVLIRRRFRKEASPMQPHKPKDVFDNPTYTRDNAAPAPPPRNKPKKNLIIKEDFEEICQSGGFMTPICESVEEHNYPINFAPDNVYETIHVDETQQNSVPNSVASNPSVNDIGNGYVTINGGPVTNGSVRNHMQNSYDNKGMTDSNHNALTNGHVLHDDPDGEYIDMVRH